MEPGIDRKEIDEAIALNRKGQVSTEDLNSIRQALKGNAVAQRHVGRFLQYANSLLTNAEQRRTTMRDLAIAQVEYGGKSFTFKRR